MIPPDEMERRIDLWGRNLAKKLRRGNEYERLYYEFLEGLALRTQENKDAVVCVSGERGLGKTAFALVSSIVLRKMKVKFDFSNVFYGAGNTRQAIRKVINSEGTAFVFDEMIDVAYSRDAMTSMNKNIAKILTKARKLNNIYFFCIPRFKNLDSTLRNDVVHYWAEMLYQSKNTVRSKRHATAALFRKDRNPVAEDPWGMSATKYIKKRVYTSQDQTKLVKRLRSFVCFMKFPPLPYSIEAEYEGLSKQSLKDTGDKFLSGILKEKKSEKTDEIPQ